MYFVDFLREPATDEETGEVTDAHPSNYEAVPGGLQEIRARVEALQRRFNEESKVGCKSTADTKLLTNSQSLSVLLLRCCRLLQLPALQAINSHS